MKPITQGKLYGEAKKEDVTTKDVNPKELAAGMKVEKEHTADPETARTITLDHLTEIPDYYRRLKKMEAEAKAAQATVKDPTSPGESTQDIQSKGKAVKAVTPADKLQLPEAKKGPTGDDVANQTFGETYKDLTTKQSYELGFTERCAAHGVSVEQLAAIVEKLSCENAQAAPKTVAFKESDVPTTDRKEIDTKNKDKTKGDSSTVRRQQNAGKAEVQPDVLKSRVSGGGAVRSEE